RPSCYGQARPDGRRPRAAAPMRGGELPRCGTVGYSAGVRIRARRRCGAAETFRGEDDCHGAAARGRCGAAFARDRRAGPGCGRSLTSGPHPHHEHRSRAGAAVAASDHAPRSCALVRAGRRRAAGGRPVRSARRRRWPHPPGAGAPPAGADLAARGRGSRGGPPAGPARPGGRRHTRLVLRHTALLDAEEFARTGPGSLALGWELALLALAAHTDGWHATCLVPVPSPGPDWLHGPEGGTYVRAWAVRWAAEAVAAGVDEATARQGESDLVRRHLGS